MDVLQVLVVLRLDESFVREGPDEQISEFRGGIEPENPWFRGTILWIDNLEILFK